MNCNAFDEDECDRNRQSALSNIAARRAAINQHPRHPTSIPLGADQVASGVAVSQDKPHAGSADIVASTSQQQQHQSLASLNLNRAAVYLQPSSTAKPRASSASKPNNSNNSATAGKRIKKGNYVITTYEAAFPLRCCFRAIALPYLHWTNEKSESITRKLLIGVFSPFRFVFSLAILLSYVLAPPLRTPGVSPLLPVVCCGIMAVGEVVLMGYVFCTKRCCATLYHVWTTIGTSLLLIAGSVEMTLASNINVVALIFLLTLSAEFAAWLYRVVYAFFLAAVLFAGILSVNGDVRKALANDQNIGYSHFIRASVYVLCAYLFFMGVYAADMVIARSASGVQEAATFADDCCKLLSKYDTKEAVSLLNKVTRSATNIPEQMLESFRTLVDDLHLYRAYLPQHVLQSRPPPAVFGRHSAVEIPAVGREGVEGQLLGFPADDHYRRTQSIANLRTTECNTVVLVLQAPEFLEFDDVALFMEAAAGMIAAFNGTVELTTPEVIAGSFSPPPASDTPHGALGSASRRRRGGLEAPRSRQQAIANASETVWEMVAAETGRATIEYLREVSIANVTAVVTSGQLCRTVLEDGAGSSHVVVHGAALLEGLQLCQIRNKRSYLRVLMSEAAALPVCEMVLPSMQVWQQQGANSLVFEYLPIVACQEAEHHRRAIREVFLLLVNGRLESALAGIPETYAAESACCRRWRQVLHSVIRPPASSVGPSALRIPVAVAGGWVPSGLSVDQAAAFFKKDARVSAHQRDTADSHHPSRPMSHIPRPATDRPSTSNSVAHLESAIAARITSIVVADDDALFPVFIHEDDEDDDAVGGNGLAPSFSAREDDKPPTTLQDVEEPPHRRVITDTSGSAWNITNKVLGGGAFATVWLATNDNGRPVAAKIIDTTHRNISSTAHEIVSEVESLSRLRHPNIVSYLSWAMVGKDLYIFMEWVSGGSLRQLLDRCGKLPLDVVREYTIGALTGLVFLHSRGTVHCDVKPHNLLVETNRCLKIADFGSVASSLSGNNTNNTNTSTTHHNSLSDGNPEIKGTVWYMSPEACRGDVEYVSDVWSLGITVAELLSGELPFAWSDISTSQSRFLQRVGGGLIMPSTTHNPTLGHLVESCPPLAQFLNMCWESDPRQRPQAAYLLEHATWLVTRQC